jgi:hypothetical protein
LCALLSGRTFGRLRRVLPLLSNLARVLWVQAALASQSQQKWRSTTALTKVSSHRSSTIYPQVAFLLKAAVLPAQQSQSWCQPQPLRRLSTSLRWTVWCGATPEWTCCTWAPRDRAPVLRSQIALRSRSTRPALAGVRNKVVPRDGVGRHPWPAEAVRVVPIRAPRHTLPNDFSTAQLSRELALRPNRFETGQRTTVYPHPIVRWPLQQLAQKRSPPLCNDSVRNMRNFCVLARRPAIALESTHDQKIAPLK